MRVAAQRLPGSGEPGCRQEGMQTHLHKIGLAREPRPDREARRRGSHDVDVDRVVAARPTLGSDGGGRWLGRVRGRLLDAHRVRRRAAQALGRVEHVVRAGSWRELLSVAW